MINLLDADLVAINPSSADAEPSGTAGSVDGAAFAEHFKKARAEIWAAQSEASTPPLITPPADASLIAIPSVLPLLEDLEATTQGAELAIQLQVAVPSTGPSEGVATTAAGLAPEADTPSGLDQTATRPNPLADTSDVENIARYLLRESARIKSATDGAPANRSLRPDGQLSVPVPSLTAAATTPTRLPTDAVANANVLASNPAGEVQASAVNYSSATSNIDESSLAGSSAHTATAPQSGTARPTAEAASSAPTTPQPPTADSEPPPTEEPGDPKQSATRTSAKESTRPSAFGASTSSQGDGRPSDGQQGGFQQQPGRNADGFKARLTSQRLAVEPTTTEVSTLDPSADASSAQPLFEIPVGIEEPVGTTGPRSAKAEAQRILNEAMVRFSQQQNDQQWDRKLSIDLRGDAGLPVRLTIEPDGDGHHRVAFLVAHGRLRDELKKAMPEIRDAVAQFPVDVTDVSIESFPRTTATTRSAFVRAGDGE